MIRNKTILLIPALFLAAGALATDRIVLKNGDILTGEILTENPERVDFRSSVFGEVSLQNSNIQEIHRQVADQMDTIPAPEPVARQTKNPDPATFVGPLPAEPRRPDPEPESKWSGQAGMAVAIRQSVKSNAAGVTGTDESNTYRFYGNVDWESVQNQLRWNWTYRYSKDEYGKQDDFVNLTQNYTHDFRENYYATAKTMYQRDFRRRIESEYLQTAEMGIKWVSLPGFEFATSAGGGYHQYDRVRYNQATQSDAEINMTQPKFIFDESLRWKIINSLTLIQKYTHLGDFTNYHFVFTAGLENQLVHDIFLRMEYRLDCDTEVYYDDNGYYDKALLTSLLYKF